MELRVAIVGHRLLHRRALPNEPPHLVPHRLEPLQLHNELRPTAEGSMTRDADIPIHPQDLPVGLDPDIRISRRIPRPRKRPREHQVPREQDALIRDVDHRRAVRVPAQVNHLHVSQDVPVLEHLRGEHDPQPLEQPGPLRPIPPDTLKHLLQISGGPLSRQTGLHLLPKPPVCHDHAVLERLVPEDVIPVHMGEQQMRDWQLRDRGNALPEVFCGRGILGVHSHHRAVYHHDPHIPPCLTIAVGVDPLGDLVKPQT
ncbi:hypothetical protein ES707_06434 [subsurface metagenome]